MTITVSGLTLAYGSNIAVADLDLEVADGEAVVLLGQSGCGKTSTMRSIAGLEKPIGGRIDVGGSTVFDADRRISVPSHKRNVGMVFQSYAIWPHLSVFENVAFALRMKRRPKAEVRDAVHQTLDLVGLGDFADRGASMLSGGQMQRVALARSLVMQPKVLLLDEPLSNLDARLRQRLRGQLRELQSRLGLTSIYVTHDQDEALALADRIALMQGGRIVQIGTPTEIYGSPRSASIADFLGVGNILPVEVVDATTVLLRDSASRLRVTEVATGADPKACIRAEDVQLHAPSEPAGLAARVVTAEFEGASIRYRIALDGGGHLTALAPRRGAAAYAPGEAVRAVIDPADVQVLPAEVAA